VGLSHVALLESVAVTFALTDLVQVALGLRRCGPALLAGLRSLGRPERAPAVATPPPGRSTQPAAR
jgi:hypothetical protein